MPGCKLQMPFCVQISAASIARASNLASGIRSSGSWCCSPLMLMQLPMCLRKYNAFECRCSWGKFTLSWSAYGRPAKDPLLCGRFLPEFLRFVSICTYLAVAKQRKNVDRLQLQSLFDDSDYLSCEIAFRICLPKT